MMFISVIIINFFLVKSEQIIIPENKNILILGDSNSQCAINDSIFNSTINISSSSDSYFYSYLKLNKILSSNQKIDTVILSFSPHNIFDNGWLFNKSHIYSRLPIYYPLMGWDDIKYLYKGNVKAFYSSISLVIKQSGKNFVKKVLRRRFAFEGGFLSLERDILKEVQEKLINGEKLPFFKIPQSFKIAENEILYLNKIITSCNKNKLKLYLVNLPKRKEL